VEQIWWCAPEMAASRGSGSVAIDAVTSGAIVGFAAKINPDLTIVGPAELPLVRGMTDALRQRNWLSYRTSQQSGA